MKAFWLVLVVILAFAAVAVRWDKIDVPDDYNPWAPLQLDAEPNLLTSMKLRRLSKDPDACLKVLRSSGFEYVAVPNRITGYGCGFHNAVLIDKTSSEPSAPFSLSCRAAVSLALWEHHVLQPKALEHFGARVRRTEHFGSYACRNVYGRPVGTRSQHATAEALDIAGFELANDRRIRVLKNWQENETAAQFLKEIRTGACQFFDAVLSPDYNEAHRDHLHLDRGPFRTCS
jgi:hypothetical protein